MAWQTPDTLGAVTLSPTSYMKLVNSIIFLGYRPFIAARRTSNQSVPNSTNTKIAWPTTDRASDITLGTDGTTASTRFTPTVAGWYEITVNLVWGGSFTNYPLAIHSDGTLVVGTQSSSAYSGLSTVLKFNGSTDYVEIFAAQFQGTAQNLAAGTRVAIQWVRFDT